MSSFSCPHLDSEQDYCIRLKQDCVPGRKGCVLIGKVEFAIPVEERMKKKKEPKVKQQTLNT